MTHPYYPIFEYFTYQGANFVNKTVLDFGGNQGNLIKSSNNIIKEENYTSVDVDESVLDIGRREFPNSKWIYYNRHNPAYNQTGVPNLLPNIDETYDVIIANSVFTHTVIEEIQELIPFLYKKLNPNGSMWFTWCNIDYSPCYKFFEQMRIEKFGSCDPLPQKDYAYLWDNKVAEICPEGIEFFVSFFKEEFIINSIKELNPINHKAFGLWPMDCIEIRKD